MTRKESALRSFELRGREKEIERCVKAVKQDLEC